MFQDGVTIALQSLDSMGSTRFQSSEIAGWKASDAAAIESAGFLCEQGYAAEVLCDGCELRCLADVVIDRSASDGRVRAYVVCGERDDIGRVEINSDSLVTWGIEIQPFARWLGGALGVPGKSQELIEDRLYWIGAPDISGRRTDVFLAFGVCWPDASQVFRNVPRIAECTLPVILVPYASPETSPFRVDTKVLSLSRLLRVEDGTLTMDGREVDALISKARARRTQDIAAFPTPPNTKWEQIAIQFINDLTVKINAGSVTEHRTFAEMGFLDRRSSNENPDVLWVLLRSLARLDGRISWEDAGRVAEASKVKKHVSDLRKRLRSCFGLADDPFEPYQREHAYVTRFTIVYLDSESL